MLLQNKSFTSLSILTAVEAVLRHVCVNGLAASFQVLLRLQVLVEVLLHAQVIVVVRLSLHDPVSQVQG